MGTTATPRVVYVGTYTVPPSGRAEGVYAYHADPASGELRRFQTVPGVASPSFLALALGGRHLYAVNETANGGVSAFAIDPASGELTFLNRQPSRGDDPCHLCVDPTGRFVIVANYSSGNITVLPTEDDGSLGAPTQVIQHEGSGPNPDRQRGPHMHMVAFTPDARFVLAADLGLDRVFVYSFDAATGTLTLHDADADSGRVPPGAGPRHFVFHPSGTFVFVLNEIDSTITTFRYDATRGTLTPLASVPTLPADFTGASTTAEIVISADGQFVYASNRGHDSVTAFAVDETTGVLTVVGRESTQGQTPRSIARSPDGAFLYAANQNTDTIVPFRIDGACGTLTATGTVAAVPTPVCVLFASH